MSEAGEFVQVVASTEGTQLYAVGQLGISLSTSSDAGAQWQSQPHVFSTWLITSNEGQLSVN